MNLLERIGVDLPIFQAPMAGISTPLMAAAVSNAGALGSISIGATDLRGARTMISRLRECTDRPFNVNVFCHRSPLSNRAVENGWLEKLRPQFARFAATPPIELNEIYKSFVNDNDILSLLLETKPRVVSFHFGLPSPAQIHALLEADIVLLATATNREEARVAAKSGVHAIVAQGFEAGGHRGVVDPDAEDSCLGTFPLARLLAKDLDIPIVAAGGIMDGAGVASALKLGTTAAQLGTAFILCPESSADEGYRRALLSSAANQTVMTRVISGRPARCLRNAFTRWGSDVPVEQIPHYPIAYDAGKALNAAAKIAGDSGYGAQWAGQGAPLARELPAADLVRVLASELLAASESRR